ncbi:MAG TPA: hypothetical protein DD454_01280 [Candidatus Moranbacteria bacterium]|nr:hypothetical protein [Candidatus Moranbacteria bacterium]
MPSLLTPEDYGAEANAAQSKVRTPEMSVVFDKLSMRSGDAVSANAIATGFSVKESELYYTWYLKRLNGKDLDSDGDYDENDWKIEAMRYVAKGSFERQDADYSRSTDSDGVKAVPHWDKDGDNRASGDDQDKYCYIQDYSTGRIYELTKVDSVFKKSDSSTCTPKCVATKENILCPNVEDPDNLGIFNDVTTNACVSSGEEAECVSEGKENIENFRASIDCPTGTTAVCGGNVFSNGTSDGQICSSLGGGAYGDNSCPTSSGETINSCTFKKRSDGNYCKHLFAQPKGIGEETGDESFGLKEEEFWGTDPNNNSTANNGKKDEENVMGLGASVFKWTYQAGDEVGVVAEGLSAIPTKHDNSGYMRMWAFSKNKCSEVDEATKRFYIESVFSSQVGILTVDDIDLDDCLEENLIDPSGGNGAVLNVGVAYDPQNPINDPESTATFSRGDTVRANATVEGAVSNSDYLFSWTIEASGDNTAAPANDYWKDVTNYFNEHSYLEGIGLSRIDFKLNLSNGDLREIFGTDDAESYYIRAKVRVDEGSDSSATARVGRSSVIIRFSNLGSEIVPYKVSVDGVGKLQLSNSICNGSEANREVCYVIKDEIIGITIPDEEGDLTDFRWKLNGVDLMCNTNISSACSGSGFTDTAFFPVTGAVGDIIEVTAQVREVDTGTTKEIKRVFEVIEPYVVIKTKNATTAWNKKLGFFKNLDGSVTEDVSAKIFQTSQGSQTAFVAQFYPDFIVANTSINWSVNGVPQGESQGGDTVDISVDQPGGSIYNLDVNASYMQSNEIRKALADFWGLSPSASGEKEMSFSAQIEVLENEYVAISPFKNPKLFMANLFSNLPEKAMFLVKLSITVIMLLLVIGIIFSVMPDLKKED